VLKASKELNGSTSFQELINLSTAVRNASAVQTTEAS
jgi:hypothetical protein